jgi:hypothetical protein
MNADMQNTAAAHLGTLLTDQASPRGTRRDAISHHEGSQGPGRAYRCRIFRYSVERSKHSRIRSFWRWGKNKDAQGLGIRRDERLQPTNIEKRTVDDPLLFTATKIVGLSALTH